MNKEELKLIVGEYINLSARFFEAGSDATPADDPANPAVLLLNRWGSVVGDYRYPEVHQALLHVNATVDSQYGVHPKKVIDALRKARTYRLDVASPIFANGPDEIFRDELRAVTALIASGVWELAKYKAYEVSGEPLDDRTRAQALRFLTLPAIGRVTNEIPVSPRGPRHLTAGDMKPIIKGAIT